MICHWYNCTQYQADIVYNAHVIQSCQSRSPNEIQMCCANSLWRIIRSFTFSRYLCIVFRCNASHRGAQNKLRSTPVDISFSFVDRRVDDACSKRPYSMCNTWVESTLHTSALDEYSGGYSLLFDCHWYLRSVQSYCDYVGIICLLPAPCLPCSSIEYSPQMLSSFYHLWSPNAVSQWPVISLVMDCWINLFYRMHCVQTNVLWTSATLASKQTKIRAPRIVRFQHEANAATGQKKL